MVNTIVQRALELRKGEFVFIYGEGSCSNYKDYGEEWFTQEQWEERENIVSKYACKNK